MKIRQYQVDVFTHQVFRGNPAAVCPLDSWLSDKTLQAIAAENNLSETAFFVAIPTGYHLRWFTPVSEVDLCGHATLASAHVLFTILGYPGRVISFQTNSGVLTVEREGDRLIMNFPAMTPNSCDPPDLLIQGLGAAPIEVLAADDYLAVFADESDIRSLRPDFSTLSKLDKRGVCVTAPGLNCDFVSRFFAPKLGVPEDPVCGSAHCELTPYWSAKLRKNSLTARQVSRRGGELRCQMQGDRVNLSGQAVLFMEAVIHINHEELSS